MALGTTFQFLLYYQVLNTLNSLHVKLYFEVRTLFVATCKISFQNAKFRYKMQNFVTRRKISFQYAKFDTKCKISSRNAKY